MKKQFSDFTGIDIYVGLDVHKKSWSVAIVVDDLFTKSFSQTPGVESLLGTVAELYPNGTYHFVYEAGFCGFETQRRFTEAGMDCMVVHPPDVPSNDRDRKRKNDKIDSKKLAKLLSAGVLSGIWVPTREQEAARNLVRTRLAFRKDLTRSQNRIKMFLFFIGVQIPARFSSGWSKAFIAWLAEIKLIHYNRTSLDLYLMSYHSAQKLMGAVNQSIKELASSPTFAKSIKRLTEVPGIGLTTAIVLQTEIADINRFDSRDQFCSFAGMVPNFHNSGEQTSDSEITMRRNASVRRVIIECAWIAVRHDPALTIAFNDYKQRMKSTQAIVRIAKKLLARIRHILIHDEPYQIGIVA